MCNGYLHIFFSHQYTNTIYFIQPTKTLYICSFIKNASIKRTRRIWIHLFQGLFWTVDCFQPTSRSKLCSHVGDYFQEIQQQIRLLATLQCNVKMFLYSVLHCFLTCWPPANDDNSNRNVKTRFTNRIRHTDHVSRFLLFLHMLVGSTCKTLACFQHIWCPFQHACWGNFDFPIRLCKRVCLYSFIPSPSGLN